MTRYEFTEVESTDLEPRDVRALTECMSVLPEGGDIYTVVGENGRTYSVDAREERCTCPDAQYNLEDDERCKHSRRVAYETGERAIPAFIDPDAVDDQLGCHVDATPRVTATDGGVITATNNESAEDSNERPEDCCCWDPNNDLPCWPCYRDGFTSPNPDTPGAEDE